MRKVPLNLLQKTEEKMCFSAYHPGNTDTEKIASELITTKLKKEKRSETQGPLN